MKFYLSALIASAIFFVAASLIIDAATQILGKPSRGVSYGIAIHVLNIVVGTIGLLVLVSVRWLGSRRTGMLAAALLTFGVMVLFPQPSIGVRLGMAMILAALLLGAMTVLTKVTADR